MKRVLIPLARKIRDFWLTPLLEGQKKVSWTHYSLRTLAYNYAVEDSFKEFRQDLEKSMIFKKLEIRSFCCEQLRVVTQEKKDDLFLEFGVYKGKSINFFAKECPDLHFIGFDSFRGLNDDWYGTGCPRGKFDLDGIAPKVRKNVELKIGDISETLPNFMEEAKGRKILFIHIDTDTYSAASAILSNTKNYLAKGAIVLFDELHCYPGWREGEYRALKEHLPRESYEFIAFSQKRAAIRILRPDLIIGS